MPAEWILRAALAVAIILAAWTVFTLLSRYTLSRTRRAGPLPVQSTPADLTLLYFTTPDCVACKAAQRPAIQRLQQRMGNRLAVVEVNAYENEQLAREWGVISVPTLYLLDAQGTARAVNYGVTSAEKLYNQLEQISSPPG